MDYMRLFVMQLLVVSVLHIASFYSKLAANVQYKLWLFATGFLHLFFSTDKKFKPLKERDPERVLSSSTRQVKRVVFIRHGESEWNVVFNKGKNPMMLVRLIAALLREVALLVTRDSLFADSNLSQEGIDQAQELARFLKKNSEDAEVARVLGKSGSSVVMVSNLRRSIATCCLVLRERLVGSGEPIHMLSDMQEVTFNIDGLALATPHTTPDLNAIAQHWKPLSHEAVLDVSENYGNKVLRSNGLLRLKSWNKWAFKRSEDTLILAGGHSLWFRSYFQTFMPHSSTHESKKKKLVNCGAVSFDLVHDGADGFCIDPKTINVIYGGFNNK